MSEKVGWLKRFGKSKIRDRYRLSHFRVRLRRMRKRLVGGFSLPLKHFHTLAYESKKRARMVAKKIRPTLRKAVLSSLALVLVLAMVFGTGTIVVARFIGLKKLAKGVNRQVDMSITLSDLKLQC